MNFDADVLPIVAGCLNVVSALIRLAAVIIDRVTLSAAETTRRQTDSGKK